MHLDKDLLIAMYRALAGSRLAEQAITDLARRGVLPGHHSGLGHKSASASPDSEFANAETAQPTLLTVTNPAYYPFV